MSTNTAPSPMQRKAGVPPMNPSAWGIDTRQTASPPPSSAALPQPQPHDDVGPPTFGFAPSSLMESSQQMGPSVSHEEFLHTYAMIQYVAQPALVSVVRTLLDENPWLTTQIRLLCDQAMQQLMALAGQQSQHASPQAPGAFHSQMGQHQSQHHPHHQQQQQPQHPLGVATPPSSARKASANASRRNTREEETDLCAVHGNWRSIKHLQYNASTRQVECIPGFHCLENNTTGSNLPTPTKRPHNVAEGLPPMGPSGMVGHGSIPPSPHKTLANPPPPRLSSRGTTPPPAPFLNAHTPPPEPAAVASPTDPDETRRLEALLNELHKTTES